MSSTGITLELPARKARFKEKVITSLHQNLECLYDQRQLCDVTVCIGNEAFQCHGLVLAAASDFFKASLTSSWCESSSRVIHIDHSDVTVKSFWILLNIVYRGKDIVTMETVEVVLKMAVFLQIKFLQEDAEQVLTETMSPSTCLGIWQLAIQYDLEQLGQKAFDMAVAGLDEVSKCEEFILLPKALLLKLLASHSKKISTDDLFRAVMRWVEAGDESNKHHLPELLPFISFPDLSPGFLWKEAVAYRNHTLRDVLSVYIDEALKYKLCGIMENNHTIQTEILARQHRGVETLDMKKYVVTFGGFHTSEKRNAKTTGMSCLSLADDDTAIKSLKPPPAGFGQSLSSCVWRNEVYVCSGSTQSRYFAVYKPGSGDWEILPDMPRAREKHSMAAVNWNVYVVGGLEEHPHAGKSLAPDVLAYNIKTRVWVTCGKLALPLQDTAAAVLGHRIYVFGGQDAGGAITDTVQCVDTLTGHVYTAGRLPSMTRGARAVSDGGTIYVATRAGLVLMMTENVVLADERERMTQTANVIIDTSLERSVTENCSLESSPEVDGHTVPKSVDVSSEMLDLPVAADKVDEPLSTVSFSTTGKFPARSHFGVYMHGDEMVVCGGETAGELFEEEWDDELFAEETDRELCYDQMGINLKTGKLTHKERTLINSRAGFCVHVLCVPDEHVGENEIFKEGTMRYCFTPSCLTEGSRLISKTATIGNFDWCLVVERTHRTNSAKVGMFLCPRNIYLRTTKVTTQFSIRMKATAGDWTQQSLEHTFTVQDSKGGWGWPEFTTFDELKEHLHDGSVIVDFTVTRVVKQDIA